jgi:uncharacterized protein YxjI
MKLYIKQSVFSFGERFYIKNDQGEDVYYVEGSFFRIPKMFKMYNMKNEVVSVIEKQMFRMLPRYNIETKDEAVVLKREFTFFKNRFTLENTDWEIVGDFWAHEYQLVQDRKPIMSITKHWFTWGDSYELTIVDEQDAILSLSVVIAIDAAVALDGANASAST